MTHAQRILDYPWSIAPDGATNGQLARHLVIAPHQTVFMATRDLLRRGLIRGHQQGQTWTFYAEDEQTMPVASPGMPGRGALLAGGTLTPAAFEDLARRLLSKRYAIALSPGRVPGVRKLFDFVSPDRQIVGDAKYYTLVRGSRRPPAKFAAIAEHVWLLEKTRAHTKFLVFGNVRTVPTLWLSLYGPLVSGIAFYFLTDGGHLELLTRPDDPISPT